MTKIVHAKHEPYWDTGHLGRVVEEMRQQGPPTIRVIETGGEFYALEGSHRLAAAAHLRIEPKLVVEIPDVGDDADAFWARVSRDLPVYEYGHVLVLRLDGFCAANPEDGT